MKKTNLPWVPMVSLLCITTLLVVALIKGMDGALLASGIGILAGIGGFTVRRTIKPKQ